MLRRALLLVLFTSLLIFEVGLGQDFRLSNPKTLGLGTATALAFSPDGKLIATAGSRGIIIWDATTLKKLRTIEIELDEAAWLTARENGYYQTSHQITFSPDSSLLVTVTKLDDWQYDVWDVASGTNLAHIFPQKESYLGTFGDIKKWFRLPILIPNNLVTPEKRSFLFIEQSSNGGMAVYELYTFQVQDENGRIVNDGGRRKIFESQQPTGLFMDEGSFQLIDTKTNKIVFATQRPTQLHMSSPDDKYAFRIDFGKPFLQEMSSAGLKTYDLNINEEHIASATFYSEYFAILLNTGEIQVWSPYEGKVERIDYGASILNDISLEDIDNWLEAGEADNYNQTIKLWYAQPGEQTQHETEAFVEEKDSQLLIKEKASKETITTLDVAPHGDALYDSERDILYALTMEEKTMKIRGWKLPEGKLVFDLERPVDNYAYGATFELSPNGDKLALIYPFGRGPEGFIPVHSFIEIYNTRDGKLTGTLEDYDDWIPVITFSPDSRLLASASWQQVNLWDAKTGALLRSLKGAADLIDLLEFGDDSKLLAARDGSGTAYLWNVESGQRIMSSSNVLKVVSSVSVHPSGDYLALSGSNNSEANNLYLWNVTTKTLEPLSDSKNDYGQVAFSADGKYLLASHSRGTEIWDVAGKKVVDQIEDSGEMVLSPNSRYVAMSYKFPDYVYEWFDESSLDTVRVYDFTIGERIASIPHTPIMQDYSFDSTGRYLYTLGGDGLLVFDVETKSFSFKLESIYECCDKPKAYVSSATITDGSAFLLLSTGRFQVCSFSSVQYSCDYYEERTASTRLSIWNLLISPDGKKLAARASDGLVQLWTIEQTTSEE